MKKIEENNILDLLNQNYNWVDWVKEIDSWVKWPNICISVCIHWWEHAWLRVVEYLFEKLNIERELIYWKIYFILANLEAYKKSLKDENISPVESRFIDENLNRCCSIENMRYATSYELKRALELTDILKNIELHFDIHSTYTKSESMLITTEKWFNRYSNIFNVDTIYSWITEKQVWKPFIDITERYWWIWIWLEAWYEGDNTWYKIWVENSIRLLNELWMIDWKKFNNELTINKNNNYKKVYWSIIINEDCFEPIKIFNHNDIVKKWEIIAICWNKKIIAEKDSYILLPSPKMIVWEEYCFLWEV